VARAKLTVRLHRLRLLQDKPVEVLVKRSSAHWRSCGTPLRAKEAQTPKVNPCVCGSCHPHSETSIEARHFTFGTATTSGITSSTRFLPISMRWHYTQASTSRYGGSIGCSHGAFPIRSMAMSAQCGASWIAAVVRVGPERLWEALHSGHADRVLSFGRRDSIVYRIEQESLLREYVGACALRASVAPMPSVSHGEPFFPFCGCRSRNPGGVFRLRRARSSCRWRCRARLSLSLFFMPVGPVLKWLTV
jgi:hypothetical protein